MKSRPSAHRCADCVNYFESAAELTRHQAGSATKPNECLSDEAMWASGWRRSRPHKYTSKDGVWSSSLPNAKAKRPAKPVDLDSVHSCVQCRKHFSSLDGFQVHHVHAFTPIERCLDSYELLALSFVRRKNGVWATDIATQMRPAAGARLASIRVELDALDVAS